MRKLIIKREKSFVGCAAKMQVYIEDATSNELTMTVYEGEEPVKLSCRKIGEIKNGEEKSFEIGEGAAKIFVIADKLSKDFCNECYQLPEGDEDIYLSGRCRFNPAVGNAFRFNGNEAETVSVGRKKSKRLGALIIIASIIAGFILGYGITAGIFGLIDAGEKTFSTPEMSITLNNSFTEQTVIGYYSVYISDDVEIMVFKTEFEDFGSSLLSASDFATTVIWNNKELNCQVSEKDGLAFYSFDKNLENGDKYSYFVYTYKSDSAYWQFYFALPQGKVTKYSRNISEWAKSVSFE